MEYSPVLKFLSGRFARVYSNVDYYSFISIWLDWYRGIVTEFHTIVTSNGITFPKRTMYQLRMAKRVAEDWSSAVCSEPPGVVISSNTKKPSIFVQGSKANTGVLGSNNFNELFSLCLEQCFALGTSSLVLNFDGIRVDSNGNIVDASHARITLSSYNATGIVPISFVAGTIRDCAFIRQMKYKEQDYYILSCHVLEDDGYVIYNYCLNSRYNPSSIDIGLLPVIRTHSDRPLFFIVRPNIANNIDLDSPLGVSVYANAIDNLKSTDQAFDACIRDVVTGQRIILMNKKLLVTNDRGEPVVPQDVKQTYMQFFGDEATSDVNEWIKEFTPKLNCSELDAELQNQLNMLSFKCGLGTHYYNFTRSGGITATEYAGERQDFVRNVRKMNLSLTDTVRDLVKRILWIGAEVLKNGVDKDAKVDVVMSDGIIEDDSKEREQDRQDVKDGIMSRVEYRAKWYGESLEEAQSKIDTIRPVAVI